MPTLNALPPGRGVGILRQRTTRLSILLHKPTQRTLCHAGLHSAPALERAGPPAAALPVDDWYQGSVPIPRQVGGVKIAMLEGKGRGMIATRDLAPGDVVMATAPLVLVQADERKRPSGELVVDSILSNKLYESKWFSVLYDGSARSSKAQFELAPSGAEASVNPAGSSGGGVVPHCPEPLVASTSAPGDRGQAAAAAAPEAPKKKGFLASRGAARRGKAGSAAPASGSAAGSGEGGASGAAPPNRREQTRLAKIVKFNCFGDDAEDLAACACRGEEPRGHIGLWPEFALLNHSCVPNSVNYVVGGRMVVRACRSIKAGEEVTISYLGRPQLLPFKQRVSMLAEDYGFECTCPRCVAEQAHLDKLDDLFLELHEEVEERLGPAFLEARRAADMQAVAEVQAALRARLQRLYGAFRRTLLAPDVRHYVVASLYDAYDLAFSCAAALGQGEDASSLQTCLKAMEAVSGGSDLHVILAIRHADNAARTHGPDSPAARLAAQALRRAHVARYGPVSEELLARLVDLNRRLHVEGQGQVDGQEKALEVE